MVKADLTRDYYADLQLQPGADVAEIKKQFKKLALAYHPDRNPGRETEVTAQFQLIQSAHEILTDPQERAKYDNGRVRASRGFGSAYSGSSGVRGNPWSDVGSQYPPPPKAPTARKNAHQPSAGAERYKKWEAPKQSAYQAAQEGAGARQKTYEAWESMKNRSQSYGQSSQQQTSQGGSSKPGKAPQVPPRNPPQESAARPPPRQPQPQTTRPSSPPRRNNSTNSFKKGFMPNTPGGDEPGASKGAYFTAQYKSAVPPDLPARDPPPGQSAQARKPVPQSNPPPQPDPRAAPRRDVPTPEPRISTPYATHGGEKLNPFETSGVHRSRSARESPQRYDSGGFARNGSGTNLFHDAGMFTPSRSQSTRGPSRSKHQPTSSVETDSDSSDDGPELNGRAFGKARSRPKASSTQPPREVSPPGTPLQRTPSKISQFRKWYKDHPDVEPPQSGFTSDSAPGSGTQPKADSQKGKSNGEPSMYAHPITRSPSTKSPYASNKTTSTQSPSGAVPDKPSLTPFEGFQRNLIDQLLQGKSNTRSARVSTSGSNPAGTHNNEFQDSDSIFTPSGGACGHQKGFLAYAGPYNVLNTPDSRYSKLNDKFHSSLLSESAGIDLNANRLQRDRFSFNVNETTFDSTSKRPSVSSFSSSAENISTKFSSKEWDGKFEGAEYFKPDPRAPHPPSRTQSGSRSRGRSPTKPTVDPHYAQTRVSEPDPVLESPGGTKFSAEEWANTFKPQTFAPPPPRQFPTRKRTGTNLKPTQGGNAAVVDDGETSDEKPLFDSHNNTVTPGVSDSDAMDVDMPPPKNTVPQFVPPTEQASAPPRSPKRPATASPLPADDASLKVNFDDLKIQDLLSTLSIPSPPAPPALPGNLPNTRPSQAAYEDYALRFARYMTAWDLYNNRFLLHLFARKNQNDALGTKRWLTDDGLENYRRGIKEDAIVLGSWKKECDTHDNVVREWVVLKEKMREEPGVAGDMGPPPRKKPH